MSKQVFFSTISAEYFGHAGLFVVCHVWRSKQDRRCTSYYSGLSEREAKNLCLALGMESAVKKASPGARTKEEA